MRSLKVPERVGVKEIGNTPITSGCTISGHGTVSEQLVETPRPLFDWHPLVAPEESREHHCGGRLSGRGARLGSLPLRKSAGIGPE